MMRAGAKDREEEETSPAAPATSAEDHREQEDNHDDGDQRSEQIADPGKESALLLVVAVIARRTHISRAAAKAVRRGIVRNVGVIGRHAVLDAQIQIVVIRNLRKYRLEEAAHGRIVVLRIEAIHQVLFEHLLEHAGREDALQAAAGDGVVLVFLDGHQQQKAVVPL